MQVPPQHFRLSGHAIVALQKNKVPGGSFGALQGQQARTGGAILMPQPALLGCDPAASA
jgi:hypothetical protein